MMWNSKKLFRASRRFQRSAKLLSPYLPFLLVAPLHKRVLSPLAKLTEAVTVNFRLKTAPAPLISTAARVPIPAEPPIPAHWQVIFRLARPRRMLRLLATRWLTSLFRAPRPQTSTGLKVPSQVSFKKNPLSVSMAGLSCVAVNKRFQRNGRRPGRSCVVAAR